MTEIVFSNKLAVNPNEYRFLEVDEALLKQLIESDGDTRICIKGEENDEAVLCTAKETFAIKQVETSNALLLTDTDPGADRTSAEGPVEIKALLKANLELQKIRPNLDPLKELLRQELFDLEQDEDADRSSHDRSTETLFNKLQASRAELLAGLKRLEAVLHRGQWWLLHPRTEEVILREILNIRLQFNWPLTALPMETLLSHFSADIPRHMAEHTLQLFTTGDSDTRALNVTRVTQFFARQILRQKKGAMKVTDLQQEWRHVLEALDVILEPRMEDLKGIALIEDQGVEAKVRLFDAQELPSNVKLRFKELFKCRAKWTLEDISPYLSEVLSAGEKEESLLLHHTRQSTTQGIKYYSARE